MGVFWLWGFGISESLHSVARLGQWLATSWCPALSLDCLTCVGRWLSLRPVGTTWTNCHNSRSTAGTDFIVIVIEPICTETPHRSELLLQLKVLKPVARNGLYFELVDYMTIWLHDYMNHVSVSNVLLFVLSDVELIDQSLRPRGSNTPRKHCNPMMSSQWNCTCRICRICPWSVHVHWSVNSTHTLYR